MFPLRNISNFETRTSTTNPKTITTDSILQETGDVCTFF